jgi:hypothetical protein
MLEDDEANCGECGNVCPEDVDCENSECNCPGASSVIACMDDGEPTCVDSNTDPNHCGDCGNQCGAGEECCAGECMSDADYDGDRLNCGECGRRCRDTGCGVLNLFECGCNNGVCET